MLDRAGHFSDQPFGHRSDIDDLEVVFVDLGATGALLDAAEVAEPRLSAGDHARAARLSADPERQALWLRARIATRIAIERAVGPQIRKTEFVIAPGGRPTLGDGLPFFSVAHSGGAALIAVARAAPVGVDLEKAERTITMSDERRRRVTAAARRLAGDEIQGAGPLAAAHDEDVLRAWVRLEAAAKALGTGIGRLLTEEGVVGGAGLPGGSAAARLAIKGLEVPQDFIAAIAGERLPETIAVATFPGDAAALAAFLSPPRASGLD